jgi:hypothetical protein
MEILGRFDGRNGQITIAQERKTGARLYVEEGVKQSYVLPGGSAGLDYVRLMVRVLEGAPDIILFGCGGGALASELHNRGCRMTVVDDNSISFEIARRYFWMPASILWSLHAGRRDVASDHGHGLPARRHVLRRAGARLLIVGR